MTLQPVGLLDLPRHVLEKLEHYDLTYQLDLGNGHWISFVQWAPDFSIDANRSRWGAHEAIIAANPVCGANVIHRCKTETGYHEGTIHFRTPATELWSDPHRGHVWEVHSWEPLDISPSLRAHCPCRDHGFNRSGKWVAA